MANVPHSSMTGADLHEPKGVSTAAAKTVYRANGAGSGSWVELDETSLQGLGTGTEGQMVVAKGDGTFEYRSTPHGRVSFINIAAPHTIAYPAAYTKINATTVASGSATEFTEGTNARLTYTGTPMRHLHIAVTFSISQSSGSNRDIRCAVFKNGVLEASTEVVQTTSSGFIVSSAIHADFMVSTGDYIEVYVRNDGATGDVRVHNLYMFVMGMTEM